MLTSGSWHLKKNPNPEHSENFETTLIHTFTSLDSDRALWVSLRITVRIHKTNGTRRYEGSPQMRGSIFNTHRQHQGDGSGWNNDRRPVGDPGSCQVCPTRSHGSRKHRNANEGLSIEMGFTPPNLWPWQIASRSFEAFNASRSFSTAWIAACAGPADTRYPSNTGIWFAMINRASFYLFYLYWDANRKLVTPHFIQINPQQLRGVHLGFEVHSGIQSKVPQQSLQFILLCCSKKKRVVDNCPSANFRLPTDTLFTFH